MKLSINIVAYRNYGDISSAVKSIINHTDIAIETKIYITDNSENAGAPEQIAFQREMETLGCIYHILPKNAGFGAGHNYVLAELDSDYHAIVNPDILLTEDSFASITSFMEQNPDVGICIPRLVDAEGSQIAVYRRDPKLFDMFIRRFLPNHFKKRQDAITYADADFTKPFDIEFGQGSFLVLRTALMKELGGFDERFFMYMEDADLCRRARKSARVMYYPGTTVVHKWEKGSHKNIKLFRYHVISMFKYFAKWAFR